MITFADEYLYITTPYLVLEDYMQQSLIEAVHRGVDVRILTPYIPDKKYAKLLTNYNYGILLREGIRIYEYTPGFTMQSRFCRKMLQSLERSTWITAVSICITKTVYGCRVRRYKRISVRTLPIYLKPVKRSVMKAGSTDQDAGS